MVYDLLYGDRKCHGWLHNPCATTTYYHGQPTMYHTGNSETL